MQPKPSLTEVIAMVRDRTAGTDLERFVPDIIRLAVEPPDTAQAVIQKLFDHTPITANDVGPQGLVKYNGDWKLAVTDYQQKVAVHVERLRQVVSLAKLVAELLGQRWQGQEMERMLAQPLQWPVVPDIGEAPVGCPTSAVDDMTCAECRQPMGLHPQPDYYPCPVLSQGTA